jgi:hypothetical protein
MMKTCRDCGNKFDPKHKATICKAGFIDQCAKCSVKSKDVKIKYLGKQGLSNKDASIEIFRENLEWVKNVIKGENARGFTANLSLGSPVTQCVNQDSADGDFDRKDKPKGYNGKPGK